jgi:hypothetical protein
VRLRRKIKVKKMSLSFLRKTEGERENTGEIRYRLRRGRVR